MNNRPTPETDAATHDLSDYGPPVPCSWGDWVAADFARKLERERDEARDERDKLQIMRKEVVAANKGAKINAQVSNSLAGKLNQAEHERDEAKEDLEFCRQCKDFFRETYRVQKNYLELARRERDEAYKIAERAIEYVGHTSVQKNLRSELDQLKENTK